MAAVKMTFSLDQATARRLAETAQRLRMAKSEVVREAIEEYAARAGRLGEAERRRLLETFDRVVAEIPQRPAAEVDDELAALRRARRSGGRLASEPPAAPAPRQ